MAITFWALGWIPIAVYLGDPLVAVPWWILSPVLVNAVNGSHGRHKSQAPHPIRHTYEGRYRAPLGLALPLQLQA